MSFRLTPVAKSFIFAIVIVGSVPFIGCSRAYRYERVSTADSGLSPAPVDINSASAHELEKLPHIGETLAQRIVAFREQNGPFRRPENLLLVKGISEKKFREIRPLIKTE